jgi:hypothetical protein
MDYVWITRSKIPRDRDQIERSLDRMRLHRFEELNRRERAEGSSLDKPCQNLCVSFID